MKYPEILIIDDNSQDVLSMTGVIDRFLTPINYKAMYDYVSATKYLFMENHKIPDLILLEITLTNNKGLDLLKSIKEHPRLNSIPILVLTKTENDKIVEQCYDNFVNAVIPKPDSRDRYEEVIYTILKFWIEKVSLPGQVN